MRGPINDPFDLSAKTKVFIAVCLNILHYLSFFDSSAINGVVPLIQENFQLNDSQTAIMKTSSSITHTVVLGIVWLLGDSFNRRKFFLISVSSWITCSLLSIVLGSATFVVFVIFRSLAAAASSIFGVLVQVMLADLFRDRALGIALIVMAAGDLISGMVVGTISSWIVANKFPWQSVLLAGPLIAFLPLLSLICTLPKFRGKIDESRSLKTVFSSAFGIFSNKSFLLLTAMISLGGFHSNALMFWMPSFVLSAWSYSPQTFFDLSYTLSYTLNTSLMLVGMLIGMPLSLWLAQSWHRGTGLFKKSKGNARAYPIVLCVGATLNSTMFLANVILIIKSYIACMIANFFMFLGLAAVSLCQQVLMMVVPSTSRAAAVALSRFVSGLVGTPSAQIVGMISDAIRGDSTLDADRFHAYQMGLIFSSLFAVAAAICCALLVLSFPGDCERAERENHQQLEVKDERTTLIEERKERPESLLNTVARSRATTLNSGSYWLE